MQLKIFEDSPVYEFKIAEIEIHYKNLVPLANRYKITTSQEAADLLREYWDDNKIDLVEEFKVMTLNRAHHVLGIRKISQGSIAGTVASPRDVFMTAFNTNAYGIIIAHNHPSGNLNPSQADMDLNDRVYKIGELMGMPLMDSIILTRESHYSWADAGKPTRGL